MSTKWLLSSLDKFETLKRPFTLFIGVKVIDISCGGCLQIGDAFFMALTETGLVYSWGDADFGKCGRGSEVTKTPRIIEKLQGLQVEKIFCGGQFSMALCRNLQGLVALAMAKSTPRGPEWQQQQQQQQQRKQQVATVAAAKAAAPNSSNTKQQQ